MGLRAKAKREKQLNRRVDLNLEIQRLEASDFKANKDDVRFQSGDERNDSHGGGMAYEEKKKRFLKVLRDDYSGKSGNISLRTTLGWNETLYENVKSTLIEDGRLACARPGKADPSSSPLRRQTSDSLIIHKKEKSSLKAS